MVWWLLGWVLTSVTVKVHQASSVRFWRRETLHWQEPWFDLQLDALNSCLFTYNTFIKLLYMF